MIDVTAGGEVIETLPVVAQQRGVAMRDEFEVEDLIAQVGKIHRAMKTIMKPDEHYGVIPGTNKPTLLKPGAEKLCLLFRLDPEPVSVETYDGDHLTVKSTVTLFHIPTGNRMGAGAGSCSTKESKYAYRTASRTCPGCGKDAIIKGKAEYGGGWICFAKKGGCGAKYRDDDKSIIGQPTGRAANEDLADLYNTVLKMANKRALIAAVLNVTAASDIFTQDIEERPPDHPDAGRAANKPAPRGHGINPNSGEVMPEPRNQPAASPPQSNGVGVPINAENADLAARIAAARAGWTPFISRIETPAAATLCIDEIEKDEALTEDTRGPIRGMLRAKAKELGYEYDKATKAFNAPVAADEPGY